MLLEGWSSADLSGHNPWATSEPSESGTDISSRWNNFAPNSGDDRDTNHHEQWWSPGHYTTETTDFFPFNTSRGPRRSSTAPNIVKSRGAVNRTRLEDEGYIALNKPQTKAISRIKFEDDGRIIESPRRHSTIDTKNSESFEDSAPWDQKAILSLDGGGIRGYSALLILQAVMKAIIRLETNYPSGAGSDGPAQSSYHPLSPSPPMTITADLRNSSHWLPCHYFDYIAGTSTGGLISIMLGRLRMSIDECISEYETLGAKVFGHSRLLHLRSPLFWPRDKYNHLNLEKVVKELVLEKVPKVPTFPGGQNFAFDENRCRTVVISYQQQKDGDTGSCGVERPYLFRTYKNLHRGGDAQVRATDRNLQDAGHDIPIWEVARATSAAPTYFKPIQIQGRKYVDGGFGANNPCAEIYEEVRKMNNHAEKCVSIIVSVGTGKEKGRQRIGKHSGLSQYINYLNFAKKWASESEATHERMLGQIPIATETPFRYFRLNVEDGLGPIKLDEWKARGSIRTTIGACLGRARSSFDKSLFPREEKSNSSRSQNVHAIKDKRSLECIELVEHRSPNQVTTQASLQNGHVIEGQEPHGHSAEGKKPLDGTEFTKDQQNGHTVEDKKPFNYNKVTKDQSLGQDVIQASHLNGHIISVKKSLDFTEIATDQPTNQDLMQASHIPEIFQPKNKTLLSMRKHTDAYLKGEEVKKWIGEMAHLLVEGRRLRAKSDPQRWEKACFGAWFQCKIHGCPRGEKEYALRGSLQKHLLDKHRDKFAVHDPEKLNKALDDCKIVVY